MTKSYQLGTDGIGRFVEETPAEVPEQLVLNARFGNDLPAHLMRDAEQFERDLAGAHAQRALEALNV